MSSGQSVAVIIPAKDEASRIGATVRAARAIPHVDLIVVVDDGSEDDTQGIARAAGASVVRHSINRGKSSAMETGSSVVAMRDADGVTPRALLFLDADLGDTAIETAALIEPVISGEIDCAIAYLPPQEGAGGHGFVTGLGRRAIERATGWSPLQPLSGQRCISREAFEAVRPLAHGWGVEVGMTIDLLAEGFTVQEIPCALEHRATANDRAGQLHRANQYKDVALAAANRRVRRVSVPRAKRGPAGEALQPYNAYGLAKQ